MLPFGKLSWLRATSTIYAGLPSVEHQRFTGQRWKNHRLLFYHGLPWKKTTIFTMENQLYTGKPWFTIKHPWQLSKLQP